MTDRELLELALDIGLRAARTYKHRGSLEAMTEPERKELEQLLEFANQIIQRDEALLRQALEALEQQAQARPAYRCHIDLEEGMEPDDCVLDSGRRDDCFYARLHGDRAREHCGGWKPIQIAKHPPQPRRVGGADGEGALKLLFPTIAALRERLEEQT